MNLEIPKESPTWHRFCRKGSWRETEAWHHVAELESLKRPGEASGEGVVSAAVKQLRTAAGAEWC